ncbi:L-histidine N(alpha)-methyltransferase [soil metagenome]
MNTTFSEDVNAGLSQDPKRLSSKYFYDKKGDEIFQAIMKMPEYYLTRSEFEILEWNKDALLNFFKNHTGRFHLIEFGAGDGLKTKILLKHFLAEQTEFSYIPIDISENILELLVNDLRTNLPLIKVEAICNDYFQALHQLKETTDRRNVVLLLGSNIGNFSENEAIDFLTHLGDNLNAGDLLLIGFDLKKDPEVILEAYNDQSGITRSFNINLLERINRELGGNFDLEQFKHFPLYDPVLGEARSYLISKKRQTVYIATLDKSFEFKAWEPMHVEISRKYDLETVSKYAEKARFKVVKNFFDQNNYYLDSLWEKLPG